MKKFLTVLLFALAISLPVTFAEAADVPGFHQVGGRHLTFTGRENTGKGARVYGYDCSVDLKENFAEQYLRALVSNYDFVMIDHYVNDYRRGQAKLWDRWVLKYKGSKYASTFVHKNPANLKNPYYCHMVVSRSKDWNRGITHFAIYVTNNLSYGED